MLLVYPKMASYASVCHHGLGTQATWTILDLAILDSATLDFVILDSANFDSAIFDLATFFQKSVGSFLNVWVGLVTDQLHCL